QLPGDEYYSTCRAGRRSEEPSSIPAEPTRPACPGQWHHFGSQPGDLVADRVGRHSRQVDPQVERISTRILDHPVEHFRQGDRVIRSECLVVAERASLARIAVVYLAL